LGFTLLFLQGGEFHLKKIRGFVFQKIMDFQFMLRHSRLIRPLLLSSYALIRFWEVLSCSIGYYPALPARWGVPSKKISRIFFFQKIMDLCCATAA
jgi:hypothetical protein